MIKKVILIGTLVTGLTVLVTSPVREPTTDTYTVYLPKVQKGVEMRMIEAETPTQPAVVAKVDGARYVVSKLHQLTPEENHGMRVLFLEVLDREGKPKNNVQLLLHTEGFFAYALTGEKGSGKAEIPIDRNNWDIAVFHDNGNPVSSDVVLGVTTDIFFPEGTPEGNCNGHVSYSITFEEAY